MNQPTNKENAKPPILAAILLLIGVLTLLQQLMRLINKSDLFLRLASIDWKSITLTSCYLSFIYMLIVSSFLAILQYFSEKWFVRLTENNRIYKLIVPSAIVTSMLLIMTIQQLEFFTLVAALSIIFQLYYHLSK